MKKRIILSIVIFIFLAIGIIGVIFFNNRTMSTITLDINPSIEITLTRKGKIKNIKALNVDAKSIISKSMKGQSLDETLNDITDSLIKNGYANEDERLEIIINSNGNLSNDSLEKKLKNIFNNKNIDSNIIVVDDISKEDIELSKKYNITTAKAAYINSIIKENDNLKISNIVNESVKELTETKNTGKFCEEGYTLEGDWCYKEVGKVPATSGEVCPRGFFEYEGICYKETGMIDGTKNVCNEEFTLDGEKCIRIIEKDAIPSKYSCTSGIAMTRLEAGLTTKTSGDANDIICVDTSNATHPMSPCEVNDGTEYTISGGKCYWHRAPVIAAGCPGKVQIGSFCWDDASNILICVGARDGKQYNSRNEYCEDSVKYTNPKITEYRCEDKKATLVENKCIYKEIEDSHKERICPAGYTLVDNDRCIDTSKKENKVNGFVCEGENMRLKASSCIIYDIIESKSN